ncbi:hypothetical protein B0T17DRAFT_511483 [Bombardia bombarda]|uniref:DUF6546 domain-containing protein n=1 Tax=Bombardia bombarda TaxID=252184 RepID=A0AA39U602_9PEZI|nr:hypothetical protein B0T17DRAFT_511483 [Bombardia bombarda]
MATTEATGWHALPFELRRKILKKVPRAPSFWRDNWPLSNQARFTQTPEIKKAMRMSVYARVCKEWQFIFEEINFRELVLSPSCIREFDLYVRHARRRMVKHIWLRIELPQLYCSACRQYENRSEAVCNSHTFTNAMWEMLKVLSSWPSKGCFGLGDDGPVLELSVHHNATPMRRRMSYPQRQGAGRRARSRSTALAIRRGPEHWTIGSTPLHSRYWSMGRDSFSLAGMAGGDAVALNYDALRPGRARQLPVAPVVKGLIVRRQARRALDVSALCKIAESLPGMDSIGLVHMRRASSSFLDDKYQGYLHRYMQQANLLKTLSIFENYHTEGYSSSSYLENNVTHSIGTALADESRSLENLSIAFVADAAVFFRDFWPAPTNTTTTTTTTTITTTSPPLLDLSRTGVQSLLLSLLPPARRLRSSPLYLDPSSLLPSPHSPSYAAFTEALLSATIQANLSLSTITYKPSWPHLRTLSITSLLLAPPTPLTPPTPKPKP